MKKLGKKELVLELRQPIVSLPTALDKYNLVLSGNGNILTYIYDPAQDHNGIAELLDTLKDNGIRCRDLHTKQSSLEDIFVNLVGAAA